MKKKKIEAFPLIELRKPKRKPYMAVAEVVELAGEDHLLIDIYEKDGKSQQHVMRAAYTEHDWGLWEPRNDYSSAWSRGSIEVDLYRNAPRYDTSDMISGPGIPAKAGWNNTAIDQQSIEIIHDFCMRKYPPSHWQYMTEKDWYRNLTGLEGEIKAERESKAWMNRREQLEERNRDVPAIPKDFKEWADKELFGRKEFMFYKRHGRFADCQCSKCGATYRIITRRRDGIDGMIERVDPVPENGNKTECRKCGASVRYRPRGRMKPSYGETESAYLLQPYRGSGTIIRWFEVRKMWFLDAKSEIWLAENARIYPDVFRNKKTDWHLYDSFSMKEDWYNHNVGGYGNIKLKAGAVYTGNAGEWNTRSLQYSGLKEFIEAKGCVMKPTFYIQTAQQYALEKIVKAGMVDLAEKLVAGEPNTQSFMQGRHRKLEDALNIRRCRIKLLSEADDMDVLHVLQLERENAEAALAGNAKGKGEWTVEQISKACSLKLTKEFETILQYMSITQFINRIEKQLGRQIYRFIDLSTCDKEGTELAILYKDYIDMRLKHGWDLTRSTSIFPKDIRAAHREMVRMVTMKAEEKRIDELSEKYPQIKRRYRKLKARYGYKEDGLMIRPAKNIMEIMEEGRTLHHCVARGNTYFEKHASGVSSILFLRRATAPNTPYITIEIKDNNILQWFGRNDSKPDRELIDKWLAGYIAHLEGKEKPQAVELQAAAG